MSSTFNQHQTPGTLPSHPISSIFILIVLAIPGFLLNPANFQLLDLPEFYTPARMILSGAGRSIYNVEILKQEQQKDFPYLKEKDHSVILYAPPPAVPLLVPAGLVSPSLIGPLWWASSLTAVVLALNFASAFTAVSYQWSVRIGALIAAFGPQWESLKHGQLAPFVLAALCAACWGLKKDKVLIAAAALSILILKPQEFLPLIAFLIGAGKRKVISYVVLIGLALTALSWLAISTEGYKEYFSLVSHSLQFRQWMVPEAGPTVRGQLLRFMPQSDALAVTVGWSVAAIGCLASLWLGHKLRNDPQWLEKGVVATVPLGMLIAVHCHNYDLLFLVPVVFILFSLRRQWQIGRAQALILGPALFIFFMPFYNKIHYEYLMAGGVVNPFFLALIVISAVCIYLAVKPPIEAETV